MTSLQDILPKLSPHIDQSKLDRIRDKQLRRKVLPIDPPDYAPEYVTLDCNESNVKIGLASELNQENHDRLKRDLLAFIPWKKGPFEVFGNKIDAEWRSDLKWERFIPALKNGEDHCITDKCVADVGCNNGYFMFRMSALKPRLILGFEPVPIFRQCFEFLQGFAKIPELLMDEFALEHLGYFKKSFDTIFCMGVLYHCANPVESLRLLHESLRNQGTLFLETQGIFGLEPISISPKGRYAHARGVWFLPTLSCLENWLWRAGFKSIECHHAGALTEAEQRATPWAPIKSLRDFLNPHDSSLTIEGYPAPHRFYIKCRKS